MSTAVELREGPLHRHFEGGNGWYIHPLTEERFMSVTTALDFADSPGLSHYWRPGLAAKAAFDELPRLLKASITKPCGRTYSRCRSDGNPEAHDFRVRCVQCPCDECQTCVTLWLQNRHFSESRLATDRGKAVHRAVAWWTLHGDMPDVTEEIAPYTRSFLRFVKDFGLTPDSWEMAEATVLNRTDRWGGTLDGRVRFRAGATDAALKLCRKYGAAAPLLSLDVKSRAVEEGAFYADMALQLAAYRRGEVVLLDDGTECKLDADDGALVVQVHPDGYHHRPVRTREEEYRSFLNLLGYAYWSVEHAAASIAVRSFPDLDIPGQPATKATPRKAAKKAVAPREPKPSAARISETAALQSATLRSMLGQRTPHPDSPFGDSIPF